MDISFLFKGILLGFSIAAPIGPISALCLRKTVRFGRLSGLFSGLGAAFADMIYALIAAFGLTLISDFLHQSRVWIHLGGGALLFFWGIKTFLSKTDYAEPKISDPKTLFSDFLSTFLLTLTNPMTIFSFLALFAGLGLSQSARHYSVAAWIVLGVFLGSTLWWLILSIGAGMLKEKIHLGAMRKINQATGILLILCALLAWFTVFWNIV